MDNGVEMQKKNLKENENNKSFYLVYYIYSTT